MSRCPRRIRVLGGPLLGGIIGIIGGIPGVLIGLLLGYLIRELFVQSFRDRRILDYFENPGPQQFYEAEPGLAAWCAMAVLVSSADKSVGADKSAGADLSADADTSAERILKQVILGASCVFTGPLADPFLMEQFSRIALSNRNRLNPDLLAESLAARRASAGARSMGAFSSREDLKNLGRALSSFATGEKARRLAREIRVILDPAFEDEAETENSGAGINGVVMGIPGKFSAFRRERPLGK